MFKARKTYWLAQIGGWALLSLLIFFASISTDPNVNLKLISISTACFFVYGIILTHFMRFFYIKMGWLKMRLTNIILPVILTSIVFSIFMSSLNNYTSLYLSNKAKDITPTEVVLDIAATLVFFILWNSVYFTFHFFQRSREQEVNNLQLTASHNEIELKNLRSQLNPHFLFNSLNSIRALIDLDPNQAKDNVTKLSGLLRKSLILGKEQLVSLEEELAIVKDYLDLEKVRFEERLNIEVILEPGINEVQIPPFILQTLVENSLKHGIGNLVNGGSVWIRTKKRGNSLRLEVENDGKLIHSATKGIGIENTERRLELQYKGKASFSIKELDNRVLATIEINEVL